MKNRIVWTQVKEMLVIFLSLLPYAICVHRLLVPLNIVGGGLTGLCEIILFATQSMLPPGSLNGLIGGIGGVPIWVSTVLINSVLLTIAFFTVGWRFCLRTLWGVFTLSFWLKVIPISPTPFLSDPFMACVVSGLICGSGLGMVFLNNGSSGGTDIVATIVNKYKHISMGRGLLMCDFCVICSAYLLPNVRNSGHPVELIMCGLCFTFMCTFAVDMVMSKSRESVQFFIFSMYKSNEIADAINTRANRGVTILDGKGWHSQKPMQVVTVLAKRYQSKQIFDLIKEIDPNAFVSQTSTIGVFGKGFDTVLNKQEQERARQLEIQFEEEEKSKAQ